MSPLVLAALLAGAPAPADAPAFAAATALGRGVNLGNALEAPTEGEWGLRIEPGYLPAIKAAGFGHVRLPVKWSAHAGKTAPYFIEPKFAARIDTLLDQAEAVGLRVVLNVHHYYELDADPAGHKSRFLALWGQIAERYKNRPDTLVFEAYNEPHDKLTPAAWNALISDVLAVIRKTNPSRPVVVGPGFWNGIWALPKLTLPAADRGLIVTVHFYDPHEFTHQGASWAKGSDKWLGQTWTGTPAERKKVSESLATAAAWGKTERRPVYLGEFGCYEKAAMTSRAAWTGFVRAEAERQGMAWAYWEFGAGFGCYDPATDKWREPLLRALVPNGK